jgi:hypothetical protein
MLSSLLLALALAPTTAQQGQTPEQAPQKGVAWGCNEPKWIARKAINKQLSLIAGYGLYESLWNSVQWLSKAEPSTGERAVSETALIGLAMLGSGANPQTGLGKPALIASTAALAKRQDAESGAIGDPASKEFLLDHTLALLTLSENYFSLQVPELEAAPKLALKALLAARGEDGLWHVEGKKDGPVDTLVTALAGYALFGARAAHLEVPDEAFEKVFAWTGQFGERAKSAGNEPLERSEALEFAGALCARSFVAASLKRSLAGDETARHLSDVIAAQVPPPPGAEEWKAPERLAEPDFAFLASLGLFQSDNAAAGRCSRWLAAMFEADCARPAAKEQKEGAPKGKVPADPNAGSFPAQDIGRFPPGQIGTTALRLLGMQNSVRELSLGVFAQ